jgi:hypothetical protein
MTRPHAMRRPPVRESAVQRLFWKVTILVALVALAVGANLRQLVETRTTATVTGLATVQRDTDSSQGNATTVDMTMPVFEVEGRQQVLSNEYSFRTFHVGDTAELWGDRRAIYTRDWGNDLLRGALAAGVVVLLAFSVLVALLLAGVKVD